jgi:mutator protein MutT
MNQRLIVCALVRRQNEYLFITQEKAGGAFPGTLHIPGGGLNDGENPLDAIKREIMEETNITVTNVQPLDFDWEVLDYKGQPTQLIFLRFTAEYENGEPKASSDANSLHWISKKELESQKHNPPTIRFLAKLDLM